MKTILRLFVVMAISALCLPVSAARFISPGDGGWELICPQPFRTDLCAVDFVDANTGWTVGRYGAVIKTTNQGVDWVPQLTGVSATLRSVDFVNSSVGYAAGDSCTVIVTGDGGVTWKNCGPKETWQINCIRFANENIGWAVGATGKIIKTTDGGKTWTHQDTTSTYALYSVFFLDENIGWIVGTSGLILKTSDGGDHWVKQASGTTYMLGGVFFIDANKGWIVGDNHLTMYTSDGGATWSTPVTGTLGTYTSVFFVNSTTGWASGISTSFPLLAKTTNGGLTWTSQLGVNVKWNIRDIHFVNANVGWAVGDYGELLKTTNGGTSWGPANPLGSDIVSMTFKDALNGYGMCGSSVIKTSDGGLTWTTKNTAAGTMWDVNFADSLNGWAVGYSATIMKTSDGGSTWNAQTSGRPTSDSLYAVQFVNANTGWSVGYPGVVIKTIDGGTTWNSLTTGTTKGFRTLQFLNENTGWVAGGSLSSGAIILKTTDGGASWTTQLNTGYAGINDILFLNENVGWAAADYNNLLKTVDGGAHWNPVSFKSKGTLHLMAINFIDDNNGWVLAGGGAVMSTSDGGNTWRWQKTGISYGSSCMAYINEDEGRIGSYLGAFSRTTSAGLPGCVWAKRKPDGRTANFGHVIVTAKFPDCIYVEHPERNAGIRVNTTDPTVQEGDFIYLHGQVGTTGAERSINASSIEIMAAGWGKLPALGVNLKNIGGGSSPLTTPNQHGANGGTGVNNVGLLVKVWGKVTDQRSATWVVINDGFGSNVKVDTSTLSSQPSPGSHVIITGISTLYGSSSNPERMLRPRRDSDVVTTAN